jgi:hypothetical protein
MYYTDEIKVSPSVNPMTENGTISAVVGGTVIAKCF